MSTATRLAAAYEAETKILTMQETRGGDTSFRRADLAEVRALIKELEAKLAREQAGAAGQKGVRRSVANFNQTNH